MFLPYVCLPYMCLPLRICVCLFARVETYIVHLYRVKYTYIRKVYPIYIYICVSSVYVSPSSQESKRISFSYMCVMDYKARLIKHKNLLTIYRALLIGYRALLIEDRALLMD